MTQHSMSPPNTHRCTLQILTLSWAYGFMIHRLVRPLKSGYGFFHRLRVQCDSLRYGDTSRFCMYALIHCYTLSYTPIQFDLAPKCGKTRRHTKMVYE